jgi:3-oxoacyl-[acyl-carrier-protein] synthase-3
MRNAVILSSGAYVPRRVMPNSYFNESLGEDVDSWLRTNLNIFERRWCDEDESTVDLCVAAAKQALDRAGLDASRLNLIIVATDTPEYLSPSTASVVQYRLQAGYAGTFDLNTACAGFVTAMDVASKYIRTDERCEYVLVIGAYAMSRYLNPEDKRTVTLFADGAGAILLGAGKGLDTGYLDSEILTLGQYYDGMGIYGGGTKIPISHEMIDRKEHLLKMVYRFPPELNPQMWTYLARNMCERLNLTPEQVDHYVFTQINIRSIRLTMANLHQSMEKAPTAMDRYGYTGSACIPIAYNDAWEKGLIRPQQTVFMIGSGGGLSFGSVAFRI